MAIFDQLSEDELLFHIKEGDKAAFDFLFTHLYVDLCRSVLKYVRYEEIAEEVVLDVFLSIWTRRHELTIQTSLKAYLFTSCKYRAINVLKKNLKEPDTKTLEEFEHPVTNKTNEDIESAELQEIIISGIKLLPAKCRTIFDLSRNGGMSYKEIASELGISIKTVETQMGIALKRMKTYLDQHWNQFISFLIILGSVIKLF